jgi:hypothetical protein
MGKKNPSITRGRSMIKSEGAGQMIGQIQVQGNGTSSAVCEPGANEFDEPFDRKLRNF